MIHKFHASVLREYDIRGVVGETLSAADAEAIGSVFGTLVARKGGQSVCVGFDGRLSSPELEAALVRGLLTTGAEVRRIGRGPTPMLYFAAHTGKADGGIMVTGSHNPPTHNGFKMVLGGKPFFADQIQQIGRLAASGDIETRPGGSVIETPVFNAYVDRLFADYAGARPLHVVWDAGNGAAGEAMAALIKRLPGKHTVLNAEIDGHFPAHHPDPTEPKNLEQLIRVVGEQHAELGVAFDGDGDRIGIVDAKGRILWGDQMLMMLAEDVLAARPGAPILADIKASQSLFDRIAALGGKPVMCRTGHSIIKTRMAELGAPLAGEMSGHIFFADRYYGYDDALYAAVRFLSLMARAGSASLADRMDALPKLFNTPEIRIACPDERKFSAVDEVKKRIERDGAKFVDIDGVRVTTSDGWWLLRASNTQPALIARCESQSDAGLARLKSDLRAQLALSAIASPPVLD